MILSDYKDFPRAGRIISLDWGLRRCGVAVSDESREFTFTRPQLYIKSQDELILNTSEWEKGVYLVTVNGKTIKVIK